MSMIYLDYNATTPVLPEAQAATADALARAWGNPSSAHAAGRAAAEVLTTARGQIASAVGVPTDTVTFVSGATEAINHAVHAAGPGRVLVSAVEHPAVLEATRLRPGRKLELLPVDGWGQVDVAEVLSRVDAGPAALVAIMAANNETGVLNPVDELVEPLRERGVLFLVDAVQMAGKLPVTARPDYLVLAAHKLGGPKGIGALITRPGAKVPALIAGGGQERGLRSGARRHRADPRHRGLRRGHGGGRGDPRRRGRPSRGAPGPPAGRLARGPARGGGGGGQGAAAAEHAVHVVAVGRPGGRDGHRLRRRGGGDQRGQRVSRR